jgi:hypothetical protein
LKDPKAKSMHMSASKITEEAQRSGEAPRTEIREELAALERYEAQHGSFPELVRAHYERDDDEVVGSRAR